MRIIHYILLKFKTKDYSDIAYNIATEVYKKIEMDVDGISSVRVVRNFGKRESNADILIEITFLNQEALDNYLTSPLHKKFVDLVGDKVMQRVTFDMEV